MLAIQEHRLRKGRLPGLPPEYEWFGNYRPPSEKSNIGGGTGWLVKKSTVRRFTFLPVDVLITCVEYPAGSEPERLVVSEEEIMWLYPDQVERTWLRVDANPKPLFACSINWPLEWGKEIV